MVGRVEDCEKFVRLILVNLRSLPPIRPGRIRDSSDVPYATRGHEVDERHKNKGRDKVEGWWISGEEERRIYM